MLVRNLKIAEVPYGINMVTKSDKNILSILVSEESPPPPPPPPPPLSCEMFIFFQENMQSKQN